MRYVLGGFLSLFFALGINSSSLLASSCSDYFDGSIEALPVGSGIKVEIGLNDSVVLTDQEKLYVKLVSDFHNVKDFKFSYDKETDYIRKYILFDMVDTLRSISQVNYIFEDEEKSVDEMNRIKSEWSLSTAPLWNTFMETLWEMVNTGVQEGFKKVINESLSADELLSIQEFNPIDLVRWTAQTNLTQEQHSSFLVKMMNSKGLMRSHVDAWDVLYKMGIDPGDTEFATLKKETLEILEKFYTDKEWRRSIFDDFNDLRAADHYVMGVDQKIDELIGKFYREVELPIKNGTYIAGEVVILARGISKGLGKEITRERILKEISVVIKQVIWYLFNQTDLSPNTEVFQSSANATIVSSNTIITTASNLINRGVPVTVYVKKGSKIISSTAYYVDPEYLEDRWDYHIGYEHNNVAIVRFPEGTFDGMTQAKISSSNDVSEGQLILGDRAIKMSMYKPVITDEEWSECLPELLEPFEPLTQADKERYEREFRELDTEITEGRAYGEYVPDEPISFAGKEGASLIGSDNGVIALFQSDDPYSEGLGRFSYVRDSKEFFKKMTELNSGLIIRGVNRD